MARTRHGSDTEADTEADAAADKINIASGQRDTGSVRKDWLSNPTGCTVLTACGPHEVAGEGRFGDSVSKHGVLSYGTADRLPYVIAIIDNIRSTSARRFSTY